MIEIRPDPHFGSAGFHRKKDSGGKPAICAVSPAVQAGFRGQFYTMKLISRPSLATFLCEAGCHV